MLVIGGAGKSGTLCVYESRKRVGATGRVIGVAPTADECTRMRDLGWVDHALQVDATDAVALMDAVAGVTDGRLADLVINCVNVPGTEMGAILATRDRGRIYFFSMATSFTAAALGAEGVGKDIEMPVSYTHLDVYKRQGVGKDIEMLVGNGYAKGHAEDALALLRESPALRQLFEQRFA